MDSLREALWASDPPPGSESARERAVRRASDEFSSQKHRNPRRVGRRSLAFAAVVIILLAATPPGREAVSWAGDLVGLGEVGGPPATTLSKGAPSPSRDPIVFAAGTAPNGADFELFAYRSEKAGIPGGATCLQTKFVTGDFGTGTLCFGDGPTERGVRISGFSTSAKTVDFGLLAGEVDLAADRVKVDYTTGGGERRTIDATVADLDGDLAKRIAIPNPTSFFVAFLPGAADNQELCSYDIRVTSLDGAGERLADNSLDDVCQKLAASERSQANFRSVIHELRSACDGEVTTAADAARQSPAERPIDDLSEPCAKALREFKAATD